MNCTNAQSVCPKCRNTDHVIVPDKKIKSYTMDLTVKCSSGDCNWSGKLIDYNGHITNKCRYRVVQCKLSCEQHFMASELSVHEEEKCIKQNRSTVLQSCVKKTESIKEEYKRNIDHFQWSLPG